MVYSEEYYKTLEVSTTATPLEIKKAYRKLAVIHHPGLCPSSTILENRNNS
jgi:curved DNA-binding protein CbpA